MMEKEIRKIRKLLRSRLSDPKKVKEIKKIVFNDLVGLCGWKCNSCGHKFTEEINEEDDEEWASREEWKCPACGSKDTEVD
jgi:DNA-directed RNA polymerase subunit RPC12/RpoP